MSITTTMDDGENTVVEVDNPGIQLAQLRLQRGYSMDYVANKLHLRLHVIELIERGDFHLLPHPVFIKGYLRAYAKLLSVPAEPYVNLYNAHFDHSKKSERVTLWQSKKETHKVEHLIKWITLLCALGVFIAVGMWWHQQNMDNQHASNLSEAKSEAIQQADEVIQEIKLSDVASVQDLFLPKAEDRSEVKTSESRGG